MLDPHHVPVAGSAWRKPRAPRSANSSAVSEAGAASKRPPGRRSLDRPADTRGATLPIDVAPLERQVFTGPHSGGQGDRKQHEAFGLSRGREESPVSSGTPKDVHRGLRSSTLRASISHRFNRSTPTHGSSARIFQLTAWRTADCRTAFVYSIVRGDSPQLNI